MGFIEIKNEYYEARKKERNKISSFFSKHEEFETERPAARQGSKHYKSGNRLVNEYDLRNWLWVCVKRNNVHFFISLQAFDRDPKTGNLHILMDRIGVYAYVGDYSAYDAQTKMMITNIELPLDNDELKELAYIMKKISECKIYEFQAELQEVCKEYDLINS